MTVVAAIALSISVNVPSAAPSLTGQRLPANLSTPDGDRQWLTIGIGRLRRGA